MEFKDIRIEIGETVNTGNFGSAKVSVSATVSAPAETPLAQIMEDGTAEVKRMCDYALYKKLDQIQRRKVKLNAKPLEPDTMALYLRLTEKFGG